MGFQTNPVKAGLMGIILSTAARQGSKEGMSKNKSGPCQSRSGAFASSGHCWPSLIQARRTPARTCPAQLRRSALEMVCRLEWPPGRRGRELWRGTIPAPTHSRPPAYGSAITTSAQSHRRGRQSPPRGPSPLKGGLSCLLLRRAVRSWFRNLKP